MGSEPRLNGSVQVTRGPGLRSTFPNINFHFNNFSFYPLCILFLTLYYFPTFFEIFGRKAKLMDGSDKISSTNESPFKHLAFVIIYYHRLTKIAV